MSDPKQQESGYIETFAHGVAGGASKGVDEVKKSLRDIRAAAASAADGVSRLAHGDFDFPTASKIKEEIKDSFKPPTTRRSFSELVHEGLTTGAVAAPIMIAAGAVAAPTVITAAGAAAASAMVVGLLGTTKVGFEAAAGGVEAIGEKLRKSREQAAAAENEPSANKPKA